MSRPQKESSMGTGWREKRKKENERVNESNKVAEEKPDLFRVLCYFVTLTQR